MMSKSDAEKNNNAGDNQESARRTTDASDEHSGKASAPNPSGTADTPTAAAHSSSLSSPPSGDDLSKIEGIGPEEMQMLSKAGIETFAQLAEAEPAQLQEILAAAHSLNRRVDPTSWGQQAALAATESWDELAALQTKLRSTGNQ